MATIDEEVDAYNAEKGAWLLKLPKHLFDVWSKAAPDQELGHVTHNKATGEISLTVGGGVTVPLPKVYNLTRHDVANEPPLVLFTESKGKVTVEGKVECKGELTPVNALSDEYRRFVKNRSDKFNTKLRTIKSTEINTHSVKPIRQTPTSYENNSIFPAKKEKNLDKRVRAPKEVVLDRIFAAFEQKPYWDLTGLTNYTDQPQAFLKEILADVCVKHTSGPHRLMYELKDQYKGNKS